MTEFREMVTRHGGSTGIRAVQRIFRNLDDNRNKRLSAEEIRDGSLDYGLTMSMEAARNLLAFMDKDNSGSVSFDEFLLAIQPPMNEGRLALVNQAFQELDSDGNGAIDSKELLSKYNFLQHPDVVSGKLTVEQATQQFMAVWEGSNGDGLVTIQEFIDYYQSVSASIDDDAYWELMMRNAWHLSGGKGSSANTSNLRVLVTYQDDSQAVVEVQHDLGLDRGDTAGIIVALTRQGVQDIKSVDVTG